MPAMPTTTPSGAVVPVPARAAPAVPIVPATAIPEPRATAPPAVIMRAVNPTAADEDGAGINGITAVTGVVVAVIIAGSRRIISGPVVIARHADTNTDNHARVGRRRGNNRRSGNHGRRQRHLRDRFHRFISPMPLPLPQSHESASGPLNGK